MVGAGTCTAPGGEAAAGGAGGRKAKRRGNWEWGRGWGQGQRARGKGRVGNARGYSRCGTVWGGKGRVVARGQGRLLGAQMGAGREKGTGQVGMGNMQRVGAKAGAGRGEGVQ